MRKHEPNTKISQAETTNVAGKGRDILHHFFIGRDVPLQIEGMEEHGADDHPHPDRDFADALLEGREPAMSGRCAARIIKTIDAIYRSAGLRRKMKKMEDRSRF